MSAATTARDTQPVHVTNGHGRSTVVLVCEHASNTIPAALRGLGLTDAARHSHAAWDPGALGVAQLLSTVWDAPLVAGGVSRLVYDCNRPPGAPDAMPARSEVYDIPGNAGLDGNARRQRIEEYYVPFRAALAAAVARPGIRALVTIHSFTPVYQGTRRTVEIGVLHDADARLADAMLDCATDHIPHSVKRNEPYGPVDGVTHTLKEHALPNGLLNVMMEIRNDLIAREPDQVRMARRLGGWIGSSLRALGARQTGEAAACKG